MMRRQPTHLPGMLTRDEIVAATTPSAWAWSVTPSSGAFYEVFGPSGWRSSPSRSTTATSTGRRPTRSTADFSTPSGWRHRRARARAPRWWQEVDGEPCSCWSGTGRRRGARDDYDVLSEPRGTSSRGCSARRSPPAASSPTWSSGAMRRHGETAAARSTAPAGRRRRGRRRLERVRPPAGAVPAARRGLGEAGMSSRGVPAVVRGGDQRWTSAASTTRTTTSPSPPSPPGWRRPVAGSADGSTVERHRGRVHQRGPIAWVAASLRSAAAPTCGAAQPGRDQHSGDQGGRRHPRHHPGDLQRRHLEPDGTDHLDLPSSPHR